LLSLVRLYEQTSPLAAAAEIPVIPVVAGKDGVGLRKIHGELIPVAPVQVKRKKDGTPGRGA
jgi:hypothetical protein